MRKNLIFALLILMTIFVGSFVATKFFIARQIPLSTTNYSDHHHYHSWTESLNLTPLQKVKVNKIDKKFYEELLDLRKSSLGNRMHLCQMMMDPKTDEGELYQKMDKISEAQRLQQKKTIDHLNAIRKILTPKQNEKFFNVIMEEMCYGHQMEMGMGMKNCVCMPGMGHHWMR